jgi:hypothetical protein
MNEPTREQGAGLTDEHALSIWNEAWNAAMPVVGPAWPAAFINAIIAALGAPSAGLTDEQIENIGAVYGDRRFDGRGRADWTFGNYGLRAFAEALIAALWAPVVQPRPEPVAVMVIEHSRPIDVHFAAEAFKLKPGRYGLALHPDAPGDSIFGIALAGQRAPLPAGNAKGPEPEAQHLKRHEVTSVLWLALGDGGASVPTEKARAIVDAFKVRMGWKHPSTVRGGEGSAADSPAPLRETLTDERIMAESEDYDFDDPDDVVRFGRRCAALAAAPEGAKR